MQQIIIGRNPSDSSLQIVIGNETCSTGIAGQVPHTVSRSHCVVVLDDALCPRRISNQKLNNCTFVNGMQVDTWNLSPGDVVELGIDRYRVDWSMVQSVLRKHRDASVKEVDIRHLEAIYNDYKQQMEKLQRQQTLTNVFRGGIPIITMGGSSFAFFSSDGAATRSMAFIVGVVFMVILFIKSCYDAARIPKQRDELNKKMLEKYSCPHCHYYFGNTSYEVIKHNLESCPKCKKKLIK